MNLSYRNIRPQPSKNYTKLLSFIYGFTFFICLQTTFPLLIKILLALWFLYEGLQLGRPQLPEPKISSLYFSQNSWQIEDQTGQQEIFQKVRIIISTGIFFLLAFQKEKKQKQLIVFYDQITKEDRRFVQIQSRLKI